MSDAAAPVWRAILRQAATPTGSDQIAAMVDDLTDEAICQVGEQWALAMLEPFAEVLGQLAYRAHMAYRDAKQEAVYGEVYKAKGERSPL